MTGKNKSGYVRDDSCDYGQKDNMHEHKHSENCGHEAHGSNDRVNSPADLYADSKEVPGIYSDEIEISLRKEATWGEFTSSLANWIEEIRSWLRSNGSVIGHIKIFAAANGNTLWMATTGKSLNAKYLPELQECKNDNLDLCRLSMTFIVFKIESSRLKKEAIGRLEKNIEIYKA
jgi:hypothetical protein